MVALLALAGLAILLICWFLFAPGPRRHRAYRRARHLFQERNWKDALAALPALGNTGRLPPVWQGRLRNIEGECHRLGGDLAVREGRYEEALEHYAKCAALLSIDANELRNRVVEAVLAQVRKRFALANTSEELSAVQELIARLLRMHSPCGEASFWQGLCQVRSGRMDVALASLAAAGRQVGRQVLDPGLYLGALLLREGRPQEALRPLSEANRVDGGCPLVTWQVGMAMLAAGGDSAVASRALVRAVGPLGLGRWVKHPNRLWIEAFPEGRSFVRRFVKEHAYSCPVFGNDVTGMIRQGQVALAEAYNRQGHYQQATDVFARLLQEAPPSAPVLRGLGIALARLERYDEAYKHLRLALEQEEPKTPLTAGYLALCAALGKPNRPEDKPNNVQWAIRLLARYDLPGDAQRARLSSRVFSEARALGLAVAREDQVRLAEALRSVHATDPSAAAALAHLAATHPETLRPEHAWLYCRAAQQHGVTSDQDLLLFGIAFRDPAAMREFFTEQQWDFDEVTFTYLECWAAHRPGQFPPELSTHYRPEAEAQLLGRSRRQVEAGQVTEARASAQVLLRLAPESTAAHDWLARLHHQAGDPAAAAALLTQWHALAPSDHLPLVRLAVLEHHQGHTTGRREALEKALMRTTGRLRGQIALLGARLALETAASAPLFMARPEGNGSLPAAGPHRADAAPPALLEAATLLEECLKDDPGCSDALWELAAVRATLGDRDGLAALSALMERVETEDSRFHYLAAVCHLAAARYPQVLEAAARAGTDPALAVESDFLRGWASIQMNDLPAARAALVRVADHAPSPSAHHARALLGRLCFAGQTYEEAIEAWERIPAELRARWRLDEPLRNTVFLAGVLAYRRGDYEQAATRFAGSGQLGLPDASLGPLTATALARAGQRLLEGSGVRTYEPRVPSDELGGQYARHD
jgi:tetratricopeptide (TPR) repeat protein